METLSKKNPTISVVMSLYNSSKYLKEAIESILSQTFSDFEFIIIDDGSTDDGIEIAKKYTDKRIITIQNEKNIGLALSLNRGIDLARGLYIARMDPDDISLPQRFEKQIEYMNENPDIMISGAWAKTIGAKEGHIIKHPTNPDEVKANLLFRSSLVHPTIIMRREFLKKNNIHYRDIDGKASYAEDLDLYTQAVHLGKISNLNKILLLYRKHEKQMTSKYRDISVGSIKKIMKKQLEHLGMDPTEEDVEIITSVKRYLFLDDLNFPSKLENLFLKIRKANDENKIYSDTILKQVFGQIWLDVALAYHSNKISIWKSFWNGTPRRWIKLNMKNIYRISKIFLLSNFT